MICEKCNAEFDDPTLDDDDPMICDECREKQYNEIKWD